jgi:hypothetical protein
MNSTRDVWEECFNQYGALYHGTRRLLRHAAASKLVEQGLDEVGSSDVNHKLFQMWQVANKDWNKAILNEVDSINNL